MMTAVTLCLIAVASLISFCAFGLDKRRAERGEWRLSEASLLGLALIGGWPGAKLGQRVWRHKTRKEPFRTLLNAVAVLPVAGIALAVLVDSGLVLRGTLPDLRAVLGSAMQSALQGDTHAAPRQDVVIRRAGKIDG